MTVMRAIEQQHDSFIGWENLAERAHTIVASSQEPGYEAANATDYLTFDYWRPAAGGEQTIEYQLDQHLPCDYFAFYAHDLYEHDASIALQAHNGVTWINAIGPMKTVTSKPVFMRFRRIHAQRFRVQVTTAPDARALLGVVMFGRAMAVPHGLRQGFASPHNAQRFVARDNFSETGHFIGRSVTEQPVRFSIATELVEYDWFVTQWRPFLRHAERKPFFFKWSHTFHPDESVFCLLDGKVATPAFDNSFFSSFEIPVKGLLG